MASTPDPVMDALTAARITLEGRSDFWLHVMVVATILVAIGVLIEVWATILEVRDERRAGGKIKWHHILTFMGAIFVAAFVGLECVAEYKGGDIETQVRSNNAAAQLELTNRANSAVADAVEITNKFGGLHSFVTAKEGELDNHFAAFKRYADDERQRTEAVIVELNADQQKLDKARNDAIAAANEAKEALAAVQAANAPRYLLPQQQTDFVSSMNGFSGLAAQILVPPSTTSDTGPLASLLESLLKQAGWKSGTMQTFGGWSKYVQVCIGKTPKPNVADAATAIVIAMRQANIQAFINNDLGPSIPASGSGTTVEKPDMTILVGSKI
jgi:hypothetical protein